VFAPFLLPFIFHIQCIKFRYNPSRSDLGKFTFPPKLPNFAIRLDLMPTAPVSINSIASAARPPPLGQWDGAICRLPKNPFRRRKSLLILATLGAHLAHHSSLSNTVLAFILLSSNQTSLDCDFVLLIVF